MEEYPMPKLIKPSAVIVAQTENMLNVIEDAARKCYLSEPKQMAIVDGATWSPRHAEQEAFLRDKIKLGHHSVLEHGYITVDFVCDRGVSHEEVRHRLQAISQESTRYCNYSKDKYGNEIAVIDPFFFSKDEEKVEVTTPGEDYFSVKMNKFDIWLWAMQQIEWAYLSLIAMGATAQEARSVLPNSLKTELRCSANVREWRHILKIRTEKGVHPQMAEMMVPLLYQFKATWPVLFEDIHPDPKWNQFYEGASV
jgi:thymidylate synthase (FAD)